MATEQTETDVDAIDTMIRTFPWLDCEVMRCSTSELVIVGSLDLLAGHELTVTFDDVSFLEAPLSWKSDTSQRVFSLLTGEEARHYNIRYDVTVGQQVYRFLCEYEDAPVTLAARAVRATRRIKP